MDIYIAAASEEREAAREMKERLEVGGFFITSRWIESEKFDSQDPNYLLAWSIGDLDDVHRADILILLNQIGRAHV